MESYKFTFEVSLKDKPNTCKGIVFLTSSVYDPLGFLAPIVLLGKKLLQDLSRQKLGWDDPVGKSERQRWERWKEQLVVTRCMKPPKFGDLKFAELHSFADASQIACGAVSYLRLVKDRIHCTFLVGKACLAHLKAMTVPRMELSAAVLAVQLYKLLREELDIPIIQSAFWPDSTCEIQYIRDQSKRFHTFVANQLSVIHESSEPYQWRQVRSELNPADDVSRGLTVDEMILNSKWLTGPQFLGRESKFWPLDPSTRINR